MFVAEDETLPVGRYLKVARICDLNFELRLIALYDADTWFPGSTFDFFSPIEGNDNFACRDAYACDFVSAPLVGSKREAHLRIVHDDVAKLHGSAFQAGFPGWRKPHHHRCGQSPDPASDREGMRQ